MHIHIFHPANKLMVVWGFVFIYYIKKSTADIAKSNNQKVRIEVVFPFLPARNISIQ